MGLNEGRIRHSDHALFFMKKGFPHWRLEKTWCYSDIQKIEYNESFMGAELSVFHNKGQDRIKASQPEAKILEKGAQKEEPYIDNLSSQSTDDQSLLVEHIFSYMKEHYGVNERGNDVVVQRVQQKSSPRSKKAQLFESICLL